eukprot:2694922-Ditylum_brightwellii.AAC.1
MLMAMKGSPEYIRLILWIREALIDWTFLVKYLKAHPTSVRQLVEDYPSYLGYMDVCLLGAGGVWMSGTDSLQPMMWQIEWPPEVRTRIHSTSNPDSNIDINDLELAGMLLGWIMLEWDQHSITNKHIG